MSTLTIASHEQFDERGYLRNVGRAALALLTALLAFSRRRNRTDDWSLRELHSFANSCESSMPNLAIELRFLASRG